jgi:hypothetical protein
LFLIFMFLFIYLMFFSLSSRVSYVYSLSTFLSCQYSVWLWVGRSGDRGSIPDRGRGFFF